MYADVLSQTEPANQEQELNRFYQIPNPLRSYEEHQRFVHDDLTAMSRPVLRRDLAKIKLRLLYDDNPPVWILCRLKKLREAISESSR